MPIEGFRDLYWALQYLGNLGFLNGIPNRYLLSFVNLGIPEFRDHGGVSSFRCVISISVAKNSFFATPDAVLAEHIYNNRCF